MNTSFSSLPLPARQSAVNAILVPVAKRLPKRVRRNVHVMGSLVSLVWARLQQDVRITKAEVLRYADAMEAIVADTVEFRTTADEVGAAGEYSQAA